MHHHKPPTSLNVSVQLLLALVSGAGAGLWWCWCCGQKISAQSADLVTWRAGPSGTQTDYFPRVGVLYLSGLNPVFVSLLSNICCSCSGSAHLASYSYSNHHCKGFARIAVRLLEQMADLQQQSHTTPSTSFSSLSSSSPPSSSCLLEIVFPKIANRA